MRVFVTAVAASVVIGAFGWLKVARVQRRFPFPEDFELFI